MNLILVDPRQVLHPTGLFITKTSIKMEVFVILFKTLSKIYLPAMPFNLNLMDSVSNVR